MFKSDPGQRLQIICQPVAFSSKEGITLSVQIALNGLSLIFPLVECVDSGCKSSILSSQLPLLVLIFVLLKFFNAHLLAQVALEVLNQAVLLHEILFSSNGVGLD